MADRKAYMKEHNKRYYNENREEILKQKKEYRIKNSTMLAEKQRQYYRENLEERKEYNKKYGIKNCEKIKEQNRLYVSEKYRTDLKFNLNDRMRRAINHSLKNGIKNGRGWITLVGYNKEDLVKRLKKTMPDGYTWQDFIEGKLHVDHIIPISVFNYNKPEHTDFKKCWALSNLRLLSARENLMKSNKLYKPFQSALAM